MVSAKWPASALSFPIRALIAISQIEAADTLTSSASSINSRASVGSLSSFAIAQRKMWVSSRRRIQDS